GRGDPGLGGRVPGRGRVAHHFQHEADGERGVVAAHRVGDVLVHLGGVAAQPVGRGPGRLERRVQWAEDGGRLVTGSLGYEVLERRDRVTQALHRAGRSGEDQAVELVAVLLVVELGQER